MEIRYVLLWLINQLLKHYFDGLRPIHCYGLQVFFVPIYDTELNMAWWEIPLIQILWIFIVTLTKYYTGGTFLVHPHFAVTFFRRYYSLATRQGPHSRPEHGSNEKNTYLCWESKPGSHHCNFSRANRHVATKWRASFLMLRSPWPILRPLRKKLTVPRLVKISPHFMEPFKFHKNACSPQLAAHVPILNKMDPVHTSHLFTIIIYAWVVSSLQVSPPKLCTYISSLPYLPHTLSISPSLIFN